jgi:hypothetical protein
MSTVDILEAASLFLHDATMEDIEHERQQMEAIHGEKLVVFQVSYTTHDNGSRSTRVEWRIVS